MSQIGMGLFASTAQNGVPNLNIVTVTSTYSVLANVDTVRMNATSGGFTSTLPTASQVTGRMYTIKKTDSSANIATVGGTINGATNFLLLFQNDAITVMSNGTDYDIISKQITPIVIIAMKNGGVIGGGAAIASWTTVYSNFNSAFNATNGIFTSPRTTKYSFTGAQGGSNAANNAGLQKNSTVLNYGAAGTRSETTLGVSCAITDTLLMVSSAGTTLNSDDTSTWISILEVLQ